MIDIVDGALLVPPTVQPENVTLFVDDLSAEEEGEEEQIVAKEEVLNVMRALDALHESAAQGREVRVD